MSKLKETYDSWYERWWEGQRKVWMKTSEIPPEWLSASFDLMKRNLGILEVRMFFKITFGKRIKGRASKKFREIWLGVGKKVLEDRPLVLTTVAHELVHIKHPELEHGSVFEEHISNVLKPFNMEPTYLPFTFCRIR